MFISKDGTNVTLRSSVQSKVVWSPSYSSGTPFSSTWCCFWNLCISSWSLLWFPSKMTSIGISKSFADFSFSQSIFLSSWVIFTFRWDVSTLTTDQWPESWQDRWLYSYSYFSSFLWQFLSKFILDVLTSTIKSKWSKRLIFTSLNWSKRKKKIRNRIDAQRWLSTPIQNNLIKQLVRLVVLKKKWSCNHLKED